MDPATQETFAPYFGDLSGVVVHSGQRAGESARAIGARAYTVGPDVVFGHSQYDPGSRLGRSLLAHELAHVGQQASSPAPALMRSAERVDLSARDHVLEREAAAASAAFDLRGPPVALSKAGAGGAHPIVFREAIALRSSNRVTDSAPTSKDNIREEVLDLLWRLLGLWSIEIPKFQDQSDYINALAAGSQVPQADASKVPAWSFKPTLDAIRKNREPTMAKDVINHYMRGLSVTGTVGSRQTNNKADVLQVQDRLNFLEPYPGYTAEHTAAAAVATATVPDSLLGGTFGAITDFKIMIASNEAGWTDVRASEKEFPGSDKFAGQTTTKTLNVLANHPSTAKPVPDSNVDIDVSIFLPSGLTSDKNNVFLFFSPGDGTEASSVAPGGNATNVHAMRSGADQTDWILIGIPGFRPPAVEAGWNSIDTANIQECLVRAGRQPTIDKIRMAAHSRGMRGLNATIHHKLINVALVDKIIALDIGHSALGGNLAAALPKGTAAPPIVDYSQGAVRGSGKAINDEGIRAIGFGRLIQDRPDVPAPAATMALLTSVLRDLPPRGSFTTDPVPAGSTSGKQNINDWIRAHSADVSAIARADVAAQAEWSRFRKNPATPLDHSITDKSPWFHVNAQDLMRFFGGPILQKNSAGVEVSTAFGFTLGIYSHHLFVAEISEELFR